MTHRPDRDSHTSLRSGLIKLAAGMPRGSARSALLHVLAGKRAEDWIQDAVKRPGRLHKYFGISEKDDIPMSKLRDEAKKLKDKADKTDEEKSLQKAINMAITLKTKVTKKASPDALLRSGAIKLAYAVPELRPAVLPLVAAGHSTRAGPLAVRAAQRCEASGVRVDMARWERGFRAWIRDATKESVDRTLQAQAEPPDFRKLERSVGEFAPDLARRMRPDKTDWISSTFDRLTNLHKQAENPELASRIFDVILPLMEYEDAAGSIPDLETELQQAEARADEVIAQTQTNMKSLATQIEAAASRVPVWQRSPITLTPRDGGEGFDSVSDALVSIGREATFTLFAEGGRITGVEDVLEGGDTDFFDPRHPELAADYFNLVKELRHRSLKPH